MNTFIALCYFALSLYGFDVGGNALMHRSHDDGAGFARLQCLSSDSGRCHYILIPPTAPPAAADGEPRGHCLPEPLRPFTRVLGGDRSILHLGAFGLPNAGNKPPRGCDAPTPTAPETAQSLSGARDQRSGVQNRMPG